jgi:hypothetical protein
MCVQKPTILRAKRSAAMPGWAAESLEDGVRVTNGLPFAPDEPAGACNNAMILPSARSISRHIGPTCFCALRMRTGRRDAACDPHRSRMPVGLQEALPPLRILPEQEAADNEHEIWQHEAEQRCIREAEQAVPCDDHDCPSQETESQHVHAVLPICRIVPAQAKDGQSKHHHRCRQHQRAAQWRGIHRLIIAEPKHNRWQQKPIDERLAQGSSEEDTET